MTKWVLKGLRTGIVTTAYPDRDEAAPGRFTWTAIRQRIFHRR